MLATLITSRSAEALYYNLGGFWKSAAGIKHLANDVSGVNPGDGSSVVLTVAATGQNNLLVLTVSWCCSSALPVISDDKGHVWKLAGPPATDTMNDWVAIYYTVSTTPGVTTVTIARDAGLNIAFLAGIFSEYSGTDPTSPLDDYVSAMPASATIADSGAYSPTLTGELLITTSNNDCDAIPATPGTGFTALTAGIGTTTSQGISSEYKVYSSTASIHGLMSYGTACNLPTAMAAFWPKTPPIVWSPRTVDFGDTEYGYAKSKSQTFVLTNSSGTTASSCSAPVLTGNNPGQFEISIDGCGTSNLASGGRIVHRERSYQSHHRGTEIGDPLAHLHGRRGDEDGHESNSSERDRERSAHHLVSGTGRRFRSRHAE
jgi:hypothetical protein